MFCLDFGKIKNENVKGILLDLDNTLYEYETSHHYALKKCYEDFKKVKDVSFEYFKNGYEEAKKEVKKHTKGQAASHSRFLYFQRFFEGIFGRTDIDLTMEFEKLYWLYFFEQMELFGGVIEFLRECREKGIKICMITDLTARIQFEKIKFLNLDKYIDFIVSSEEAGAEKPHENVFSLALEKMKMKPEEVIVIGDDYKKDFIGAQNYKIKAILINDKP